MATLSCAMVAPMDGVGSCTTSPGSVSVSSKGYESGTCEKPSFAGDTGRPSSGSILSRCARALKAAAFPPT